MSTMHFPREGSWWQFCGAVPVRLELIGHKLWTHNPFMNSSTSSQPTWGSRKYTLRLLMNLISPEKVHFLRLFVSNLKQAYRSWMRWSSNGLQTRRASRQRGSGACGCLITLWSHCAPRIILSGGSYSALCPPSHLSSTLECFRFFFFLMWTKGYNLFYYPPIFMGAWSTFWLKVARVKLVPGKLPPYRQWLPPTGW